MFDISAIKDEIHVLFTCTLYDNFRKNSFFQIVTENIFLELENADNFNF